MNSVEPAFTLTARRVSEGYFLVALTGEWDLYNQPEVDSKLQEAVAAGEQLIVVDLSEATYIDSSVLGALVGARERLKAGGGEVAIVTADPQMRKIFEITGLDGVFTLHESIDDVPAG